MKHSPFILFWLSFLTFCTAVGFCVFLLLFPFGLFYPVIACDTKVLELGMVNSNTDIDCRFEIKNTGSRQLYLKEAVPACGSGNEIKIIGFSLEPIPPGGQKEIIVQFHPYSLRDKALKKVVILSNDPKFPRFVLSVSATVNHVPDIPSPPPTLAPMVE